MSRREDRARYLVAADGKRWSDMYPEEKDVYRKQAEREGFKSESETPDETNPANYIETAMRGRLDDLNILIGTAEGKGEGWADPDKLEALGVEEKHATEDDGVAAEEARERLEEYPLCVESTSVFEIVLGTGGPDDRLIVECDSTPNPRLDDTAHRDYTIRRILYRYSWTGDAERVLSGDDYTVAEAFARRVVPELAE